MAFKSQHFQFQSSDAGSLIINEANLRRKRAYFFPQTFLKRCFGHYFTGLHRSFVFSNNYIKERHIKTDQIHPIHPLKNKRDRVADDFLYKYCMYKTSLFERLLSMIAQELGNYFPVKVLRVEFSFLLAQNINTILQNSYFLFSFYQDLLEETTFLKSHFYGISSSFVTETH